PRLPGGRLERGPRRDARRLRAGRWHALLARRAWASLRAARRHGGSALGRDRRDDLGRLRVSERDRAVDARQHPRLVRLGLRLDRRQDPGEGAFTRDAPNVMLTEIHRQATESAIIRLATMARTGEPIGFGTYG